MTLHDGRRCFCCRKSWICVQKTRGSRRRHISFVWGRPIFVGYDQVRKAIRDALLTFLTRFACTGPKWRLLAIQSSLQSLWLLASSYFPKALICRLSGARCPRSSTIHLFACQVVAFVQILPSQTISKSLRWAPVSMQVSKAKLLSLNVDVFSFSSHVDWTSASFPFSLRMSPADWQTSKPVAAVFLLCAISTPVRH